MNQRQRQAFEELAARFRLTEEGRAAILRQLEAFKDHSPADPALVSSAETVRLNRPLKGRPAPSTPVGAARFEDLGLLGHGGTGQVRRVRDPALRRTVALKVLRSEVRGDTGAILRFVEEARITAQLEHPGILPVHELGYLPDQTPYFTMKEVRGRTLQEVIQEVHEASDAESWRPAPSGWTFRRLVDAFHRACQAVAYAHSRGVIHRDLKPQNLMVGDYGEVLVLDWGLAKLLDPAPAAKARPSGPAPRPQGGPLLTHEGEIAGTPAYMPPEQARGEAERMGPASDVYALGAVLFEILTGRPPYAGRTTSEVLDRVERGQREPITGVAPIPGELAALCEAAMALAPEDRPADAGELARSVADWLEGARKRERALQQVASADARQSEARSLREQARAKRAAAAEILGPLASWTPEEEKRPGWALEEEATALERAAALAELEWSQGLAAALMEAPDLPEAHQRLADQYRAQHEAAEARHDEDEAARLEVLLRAHDRGWHAAYLKGDGALSLVTEPEGAEVLLYRYETRHRRLVPVFVRSLGATPLRAVSLPRGSYLLLLRAPGRAEVRYPVAIGRGERWDGARPGDQDPFPIYLPRLDELGPDDVYVPAGWCWLGDSDPSTPGARPPGRVWLDGYVVRRFPVTHGEVIALLDHLCRAGRRDEALALAPRTRDGHAIVYAVGDDGRFRLQPDAEGDLWDIDWPAFLVTWEQATGLAAVEAARAGLPWRLPLEAEWEKAARGVDQRLYPWGSYMEPTWACLRGCRPGRLTLSPVHAFPIDESPYGIRGLAGNVMDLCQDPYTPGGRREGPLSGRLREGAQDSGVPRVGRGGAWSLFTAAARVTRRMDFEPSFHDYTVGFRLARSLA